MAILLTFPLTQDLSTGHFGIPQGTVGRDGHPIVGVCLHVLETTLESYIAYLGSVRVRADVRPNEHGSVHYGVEAGGAIHQFIADSNTAWGVRELSNPTWELLPDYSGIDVDYLFIHIGVERFISPHIPTLMFRALAELVAKLCDDHSVDADADHIISHTALDDSYDDCADALAANLIATVQSIIAQGTGVVSYNTAVLAAQVASLQTQVDTLSDDVEDALTTINTYAAHVTTIAGASTLGHIKSSSTLTVNGTTGVASVKELAAAYRIAGGTQVIVANITAVVQFPTEISDALDWVTPGVFQKVTPTVAGLYRLRARVQFAAATWTAGKVITLDVFKNDSLLQTIAYKVIEANLATKIVDVQGECEFVASVLTDYYDVRLTTDDANGSKTLSAGEFVLEKIGA